MGTAIKKSVVKGNDMLQQINLLEVATTRKLTIEEYGEIFKRARKAKSTKEFLKREFNLESTRNINELFNTVQVTGNLDFPLSVSIACCCTLGADDGLSTLMIRTARETSVQVKLKLIAKGIRPVEAKNISDKAYAHVSVNLPICGSIPKFDITSCFPIMANYANSLLGRSVL